MSDETKMTPEMMKAVVAGVKSKMRITKVVATRSVKTQAGDFFVGFSSEWDTVQDDGTQGMETLMEDSTSGMSFVESKIARYVLAMQADIAAYESALANGAIDAQRMEDTERAIKARYGKLIQRTLEGMTA